MKIRADHVVERLPAGPQAVLTSLRAQRGFDAQAWLDAKMDVVARYLAQAGLRGVVVGVSGGIDSSVVAAMMVRLRDRGDVERVALVALPALDDAGVTGQADALARAQELGAHLNCPIIVSNLAPAATAVRAGLEAGLGTVSGPWAAGQGISVLRTMALYQTASLLAQDQCPALVVGTTNRDEGAYLGYVGKASDGMVDIQVISDLHKSEVRQVALLLGVPRALVDVVPTGDMFDACPDTDVFGAPYDAVELLILGRTLMTPAAWAQAVDQWSDSDRSVWQAAQDSLEQLHRYNAHKYRVGSPAVHLDLMDSAMPGGWAPARPEPHRVAATNATHKAALRVLPGGDRQAWVTELARIPARDTDGLAVFVPDLLSDTGLSILRTVLAQGPWQAADAHGQWRGGRVVDAPSGTAGSWRTTFEDAPLAHGLWTQLQRALPAFRHTRALSRFDGADGAAWRLVGINPVFRVIRYDAGGVLVPHYDGPFEASERRRSGMSVVLCIDHDADNGGALRFIVDPLAHTPVADADFADWSSAPDDHEIAQVCATHPGGAWVFDHRMLHDSSVIVRGHKTIIRTDVLFERVGP